MYLRPALVFSILVTTTQASAGDLVEPNAAPAPVRKPVAPFETDSGLRLWGEAQLGRASVTAVANQYVQEQMDTSPKGFAAGLGWTADLGNHALTLAGQINLLRYSERMWSHTGFTPSIAAWDLLQPNPSSSVQLLSGVRFDFPLSGFEGADRSRSAVGRLGFGIEGSPGSFTFGFRLWGAKYATKRTSGDTSFSPPVSDTIELAGAEGLGAGELDPTGALDMVTQAPLRTSLAMLNQGQMEYRLTQSLVFAYALELFTAWRYRSPNSNGVGTRASMFNSTLELQAHFHRALGWSGSAQWIAILGMTSAHNATARGGEFAWPTPWKNDSRTLQSLGAVYLRMRWSG